MKRGYLFLLFPVLFLLYLFFFPVAIDPVVWRVPKAPELEGKYRANDLLNNIKVFFPGQCPQCEDIALDKEGRIYGGAGDGRILRFESRGSAPTEFANTGGRPLGMDFDGYGNLIVADSYRGLLSINPTGGIEVLATQHNGVPFRFANDLEVAGDGTIYFSDSSTKFFVDHYKLDLLEHRPNGRLFAYYPQSGETRLLLDELYFANGIAVSHDQSFVLINETGTYRVRRYWLRGERAGQTDIFINNLPGFPGGISKGSNGIFWLALVSPRNPAFDASMMQPPKRELLARLPDFLRPAPERYAFILGLDRGARVVYNLQGPESRFSVISSVQEFNNKLYLGSLADNGVGVIDRPN